MRPNPLVLVLPCAALLAGTLPPRNASSALRCTMVEGPLAMLGVVADTLQRPLVSVQAQAMSASYGLPPGPGAEWTPESPMPTAVVRVSGLNPAARDSLAALGVTDATPTVVVQARPYGADCRTLLWTDSQPWVVPTDAPQYFSSLQLAPRQAWIDGRPTFVVQGGWQTPYPQRLSGLAAGLMAPPTYRELAAPLTRDSLLPAATMFSYDSAVRRAGPRQPPAVDDVLAWARANRAAADREPMRSRIKRALLNADLERARPMTSAFAGTWQLLVRRDDEVWGADFRTRAYPQSVWYDDEVSVLELIDGAGITGYSLSAYGAGPDGALPTDWRVAMRPSAPGVRPATFTLAVADRITAVASSPPDEMRGELRFQRRSVPEAMWSVLDPWVQRRDTTLPWPARLPPPTEADDVVRLPLTLRRVGGLWRAELREGSARVAVQWVSDEVLR